MKPKRTIRWDVDEFANKLTEVSINSVDFQEMG